MAIESSRVVGPQSMDFLRDLGRCLAHVTGEAKSMTYLLQRLSVAVQRGNAERGNATSLLGTKGHSAISDIFFLVVVIVVFVVFVLFVLCFLLLHCIVICVLYYNYY